MARRLGHAGHAETADAAILEKQRCPPTDAHADQCGPQKRGNGDRALGQAARALVDTSQNISEICYACGFNNLSNFNRIFKAKRGMSPREFRQIYKKTKVIV